MKFIKLSEDRYLVKDSNGKIVSKKEVTEADIVSNECVKDLVENGNSTIEETKQTKRTNNKQKRSRDWRFRFYSEW